MGLLMLRGISGNGPLSEAKQRVIDAFDTNYLLSADEVTANILHLAQNMKGELPGLTSLPQADLRYPSLILRGSR
jgi:ribosomal protein S10